MSDDKRDSEDYSNKGKPLLGHEWDSSWICYYCGIAAEKTREGSRSGRTEECPARLPELKEAE